MASSIIQHNPQPPSANRKNSDMNAPNQWGQPQFAPLEERRRAKFRSRYDNVSLRLRRSISWLGRAEAEVFEREAPDYDAAFIFYWIAFNAAYSEDSAESRESTERRNFQAHFDTLLKLDAKGTINQALWNNCLNETMVLLENPFVFEPYWKYQNGVDGFQNWERLFDKRRKDSLTAILEVNTRVALASIFDRMYVLRNQLIHGGATHGGKLNRAQVSDGAKIMASLVPLFISLMMDNPSAQWGKPYYPPVFS